MNTAPRDRDAGVDLIAIPRAVVSLAAEVVQTMERAVVGGDRVRTAAGNAWEAICADRARAHQRDEIRRLVAALTAARTDQPARDVAGQPLPDGLAAPAAATAATVAG
ncbi:hypothetical protein ACN27F_30595 [Solwaraspora sp. WMMB335]|uniref:hypothetical protein n=1 Tax=Solwaraspora sp. WMMB335 TaxID=3404118 RepID=UPI003B9319C3